MTKKIVIELTDYKIQSTGSDGGHHYLITKIEHKGKIRNMIVYFKDKSDERKVLHMNKVNLRGEIVDEGTEQYLSLINAELLN